MDIHVDFVSGKNDLSQLISEVSAGTLVFHGEFPARDNDGANAITLTLPDADGVVRAHPH
jgi:hypothetical protein